MASDQIPPILSISSLAKSRLPNKLQESLEENLYCFRQDMRDLGRIAGKLFGQGVKFASTSSMAGNISLLMRSSIVTASLVISEAVKKSTGSFTCLDYPIF